MSEQSSGKTASLRDERPARDLSDTTYGGWSICSAVNTVGVLKQN